MSDKVETLVNREYKWGFVTDIEADTVPKGLSEDIIRLISAKKGEPQFMLDWRLKAYRGWLKMGEPHWPNVVYPPIDYQNMIYYAAPKTTKPLGSLEEADPKLLETYQKLGIPLTEQKLLAGVAVDAIFDSVSVGTSYKKQLGEMGIIFCSFSEAVREHPDLVRKYLGSVVPASDNFFAALNSAVFSGGSFIYIPKGVHVSLPIQAYFRINASKFGQFERTLIIADEGSRVHYIEGCTAPVYSKDSLHSAVVEIAALPGSHVRYTTLQNWSKNVYNLVTKRAYAFENATVEWVDANMGSKVTMKYPSVFMKGRGARADILSVAFAGEGQHQDTGAKAVHLAPDTSSRITAKSVSKDGGRTTYRGLLHVARKAGNVKSSVRCDALLLDEKSKTDTYPYNDIQNDTAVTTHEASVGKIGEEQLFYLMSRGLSENDALNMIVTGFFDAFAKEIPLEYAVEFNRLIQLEMSGAVG